MSSMHQIKRSASTPAWTGAAFIVEAMLLLVFLIGSVAVFTQLFGASIQTSSEDDRMTAAIAAAQSAAERFAADPVSNTGSVVVDDLAVQCQSQAQTYAGGTLYRAVITVYEIPRVDSGELSSDSADQVSASGNDSADQASASVNDSADQASVSVNDRADLTSASVADQGNALYTLETAHYESGAF